MSESNTGFAMTWSVLTTRKGLQGEFNILLCWKWVGIVNCTFCMLHPVASYTPGREVKPFMSPFGAFAKLWKTTINFVMSVCPSAINKMCSHWADFHEISYSIVFGKSVEKIQVSLKMTRITLILLEGICLCMIISRSVLIRMRNFSDKFVDKIKTHILFSVTFPRK
jgi:hypothetical protein